MTRLTRWLCLLLLLTVASMTVGTATTILADSSKHASDDSNDKKDKDKEKEKDKDKDKGKGNDVVDPAVAYRVDVSCLFDAAADQTVCTFTGIAPEGAKKVGHVDLPAADVCAEVLGGDAEFVDPDPNTRVVGYKSKGSRGVFSLILAGEVTTGGTATYWFKTGDGVFPASGPGLVCGAAHHSEAAAPTEVNIPATLASPATAEAAAGGAVAVHTYACAAEADPAAVDWFSECQPGVAEVRFTLSTADPTQPETAGDGETDPTGEIRFDGLAPGSYQLDAPDDVWCHAESDSVNDRGELVVTPGAEVSVWIFLCGSEAVA